MDYLPYLNFKNVRKNRDNCRKILMRLQIGFASTAPSLQRCSVNFSRVLLHNATFIYRTNHKVFVPNLLQLIAIANRVNFLQVSLIDLNATNLKYPTNYFKKYSSWCFCLQKEMHTANTLILIAGIFFKFSIGNT